MSVLLHSEVHDKALTIWEYIQQPEHPWFDTTNYEWWQILMFGMGALLWIVVYLKTLHRLKKDKELDIPLWAVTLNFGCEVTTAIFFVPDMGLLLVIAYWAWMVLDVFIVIGLIRYAHKQVTVPMLRSKLWIFFAVWMPLAFLLQYHFILKYDLPMAPVDSFTINLVMSVCFIYLIFVPRQGMNSQLVAWCKFLGTGIIGIMFYTKYPGHHYLTILYIACAFFDIAYIVLLHHRRKHGIQADESFAVDR